jgi:hypothetical protein
MNASTAIEQSQARTPHVHRRRAFARPERTGALADRIAMHIESLVPRGRAKCLDVGCGDLTLAESVEDLLLRTDWHCIDVLATPSGSPLDGRWRSSRHFDGRVLPYSDGEFDVALLSDTLHRAPQCAARLLVESGRVARHVLVKDRFGSGLAEQYFTQEAFGRLVAEQGLVITALDCGLNRDDEAPVVAALRGEWQFIAVLSRT